MQLKDLVHKVPFGVFFGAARTKLNGTIVKYNSGWYLVNFEVDPDEGDEGSDNLEYGSGINWLRLYNMIDSHYFNSLDEIELEFPWPDAGNYFYNDITFKVKYNLSQVYKAGLSPNQIDITTPHGAYAAINISTFLQAWDRGLSYPCIEEAIDRIKNTNQVEVPISLSLLVGAHPYVDAPVLLYNDNVIGIIKEDNSIKLNNNNYGMRELLTHLEVQVSA